MSPPADTASTRSWAATLVWIGVTFASWALVASGAVDVSGLVTVHWVLVGVLVVLGWHVALRLSPLRRSGLLRIVLVTVLVLLWNRFVVWSDVNRQDANVVELLVGMIGLVHMLLWAGFARRAPLPARLFGAGVPLAFAATLAVLLGAGFAWIQLNGNLWPVLVIGTREAAGLPTVSEGGIGGGRVEGLPGVADSLQFFGPRRDGRLDGPRLATDWSAHPPEELWRVDVGAGWSGFAVHGRRAVTQEQYRDPDPGEADAFIEREAVVCRDLGTGEPLWVHANVGERYDNPVAGVGPRATPVIDPATGLVYTMGATGIVDGLHLESGERAWSVDLCERFDAPMPEWGFSASPLLVDRAGGGKLVVVTAGAVEGADGVRAPQSLVALDAATGATVWAAGREAVHWSSPVLAVLDGVRQILVFGENLRSHDVETGRVLWVFDWKPGHPHVAVPIVVDSTHVVVGSGYGAGTAKVRVWRDGAGDEAVWRTDEVWKTVRLKPKFANFVVHDGHVYGLDDGRAACLDLETGRRLWKQRGDPYDHGQLLVVDGRLLFTTEWGEVVLVEPTPEEHRELTRMRVLAGDTVTWNPPTLAGRYLIVRSDREAACFRLPVVE